MCSAQVRLCGGAAATSPPGAKAVTLLPRTWHFTLAGALLHLLACRNVTVRRNSKASTAPADAHPRLLFNMPHTTQLQFGFSTDPSTGTLIPNLLPRPCCAAAWPAQSLLTPPPSSRRPRIPHGPLVSLQTRLPPPLAGAPCALAPTSS